MKLPSFNRLRTKQHLLLWSCIGFLLLVVGALLKVVLNQQTLTQETASYKAPITTGSRRTDPKEVWMEKVTTEMDLNTKRLDSLEKMLHNLLKLNSAEGPFSAENAFHKPVDFSADSPSALRQEIQQVGQQDQGGGLKSSAASATQPNFPQKASTFLPAPASWASEKGQTFKEQKQAFRSKGIQKTSLQLQNAKSHKPLKTTDNTIPAGAFAQAVLMGGVDASTSIQASSDPRPVLLRITNAGTLPRKFKSDLCDCHALAACYGDLSSERVFMRLERITCTERKTGELIEIPAQGYIAGEDGRAGLRGTVVDRAGESMRNAAIGGFLSGLGNFLSQSPNAVTFSPMTGLAQTNPLTNGELLKHGAAKGASGALERYADFYIKRAEQMQPVIQVQAGRVVDLVFTQGVALGDSAVRGALVKVNDQQRYQQIHQTQAEASLKPAEAWVPSQGE